MKTSILKWHLAEMEKPTKNGFYLVADDIDKIHTYDSLSYSVKFGKFNCVVTDRYAMYPKYWAEVEIESQKKDELIFSFIDKCYDGTDTKVLSTIFINTLLELGILSYEEATRFTSYDTQKFHEFCNEIFNSN